MKNNIKILLLLLVTVSIFSCNTKKEDEFLKLSGKIEGLTKEGNDNFKLKIYDPSGGREAIDSVTVKEGSFYYTRNIDSVKNLSFMSREHRISFRVIVEEGEVDFSLDATKHFRDPSRIAFTKGEQNLLLANYTSQQAEYFKKYEEDGPKKTTLAALRGILNKAQTSPNSIATLYALRNVTSTVYGADMPEAELQNILDFLKPNFENSKEFKSIQKKLETSKASKRKAGMPIVDYAANTPDGKEIKLSDYYGKSYVLIDLWAAWCGPCRQLMPHVKKAHDKYKDQGFQVVAISFDKDKDAWLKAIEDDGLQDFIHMSELKLWENKYREVYNDLTGIPDNILIDKEGTIIANTLHGKDLHDVLDKLYNDTSR